MLEDNIFIYKRLSSDVSNLVRTENRNLYRKTDSCFNFKFVKKAKHPMQKARIGNEEEDSKRFSPRIESRFRSGDNRIDLGWEISPKNIKFCIPETVKDPLKIHQLLKPGDDINTLIKFILDFMKQKFKKSSTIEQLCTNKFDLSKLDMENEIAMLDKEISGIDDEMNKWEEAFNEVKNNNKVSVDFTFQDVKVDEIRRRCERISKIKEDFDRKECQLIEGMKGIEKIVENSQIQCEDLFRKILKIVERNNGYDSMVILKAMSRMGSK